MHVKTSKAPPTTGAKETRPREPARLQTGRIRVVALVVEATGEVLHRDCYDPDERGKEVMKIVDGELWLRVIKWARSRSMDAEVGVRWEPTGFAPKEISRVSVFTWPLRHPIRVFEEQDEPGPLTPAPGPSR